MIYTLSTDQELPCLNLVPGQTLEVDETIHAIRCTETKFKEIRYLTEADDTLQRLALTITEGWPESAKDLHKDLRSFWSCRESSSVEDGIIMKGDKIFIPSPMREEVLEKIHIGHQGITKSQAYARTSVYWQGMDKDVEGMCRSCPQCQSHQRQQSREPLTSHEVPSGPWQTIGTDLFYLKQDEYLIVVDYFSKMYFIRKVPSPSSSLAVVKPLKQIFSEHGIPEKVVSDNGPHFSSQSFTEFSKSWGFEHATSSPHYPRSNG